MTIHWFHHGLRFPKTTSDEWPGDLSIPRLGPFSWWPMISEIRRISRSRHLVNSAMLFLRFRGIFGRILLPTFLPGQPSIPPSGVHDSNFRSGADWLGTRWFSRRRRFRFRYMLLHYARRAWSVQWSKNLEQLFQKRRLLLIYLYN